MGAFLEKNINLAKKRSQIFGCRFVGFDQPKKRRPFSFHNLIYHPAGAFQDAPAYFFAYEEDFTLNDQNETAQLRYLEETATRLRQNGFTVSSSAPFTVNLTAARAVSLPG